MAGKGGGGAWKVAYADFVTAMMAFFLVMWICGQDQKVRRSVSDYFSDPFGSASTDATKKPSRSGSLYENIQMGVVPLQDNVPLGKGRKPHTINKQMGRATKLFTDWLYHDKEASAYWHKQAEDQREAARWSTDVKTYGASADKVATRLLYLQLQDEMTRQIIEKSEGIKRDMLDEMVGQVNWAEIAEDLILR